MCYITPTDTGLDFKTNCQKSVSLYNSLSRRSKAYWVDGRRFFLSMNSDINEKEVAVSYISLYYVNTNNKLVFNNLIDGNTLQSPQ